MDIDGAIQAHANWKLRLFAYAQGKALEKPDLQSLRKDDVCKLGQWLYGAGRKYAGDPAFEKLVKTHAEFHAAAAALGALVERGQSAAAEAQLHSSESDFNRLSFRVVARLTDLRGKAALV